MKTTLYLIACILSFLAAAYFSLWAIMAAWLGATPEYDVEYARSNFQITGSISLVFFVLAVFSLVKFLSLTRRELREHKK